MSDLAKQVFALPKEIELLLEQAFEEREQEGEVSPQLMAELERVALDMDRLITAVANWQMYSAGKLEGAKAELKPIIEALRGKLKSHERKVEFVEFLLGWLLPPGAESIFANDQVAVSYRPSVETVAIAEDAEESLPIEFCETKYIPIKARIKEAIQAWEVGGKVGPHPCPGWALRTNWNVQVKMGGPGAIKNAKEKRKKLGLAETPLPAPRKTIADSRVNPDSKNFSIGDALAADVAEEERLLGPFDPEPRPQPKQQALTGLAALRARAKKQTA